MDKSSSSLNSSTIANFNLLGDKANICNNTPMSEKGKRIQMVKMLCLTVLPILVLWSYCVVQLTDLISSKTDNEKMRDALQFSIDVGKLIHHLQKERDLSILYLSALGPETKTFLVNEYQITDQSIDDIPKWPGNLDRYNREAFQSKSKMMRALNQHRQTLDSKMSSIEGEIQFYTSIIDIIMYWGYNSIAESKFSVVWKSLVAFQKITASKEDLGLERALGTMFYARGGFETHLQYEMYNMKLFGFRANYQSARQYSPDVDFLGSYGLTSEGRNISEIILRFRKHIQENGERDKKDVYVDLKGARWHYDNTTIYIDQLLSLQTSLGKICLAKVNRLLDTNLKDLIISASVLVFVLISCSLVIFSTENLISSIQKYAVILVGKTKELNVEKKRTDSLLYQMVPKQIADKLKKKQGIDAEYFKAVTVLFSDIYSFSKISLQLQPLEIVQLLNALYAAIDVLLDDRDLYKVETINDSYMVVSGLPQRNNHRHASEIADFSLSLIQMVKEQAFASRADRLQLRIGINTGPCMAGIVGSKLPRYCLFGDTVNTASRMKSHSMPNKIHISHTTYVLLAKTESFYMRKRGTINVKGKGEMLTYWLTGSKITRDSVSETPESPQSTEMPGEVAHNKYTLDALGYNPLPGRKNKTEEKVTARVPPSGVTKVANKKQTVARQTADIIRGGEHQAANVQNTQDDPSQEGNNKNDEERDSPDTI